MNRLLEVLILWALSFFYNGLVIIGTLGIIYKKGLRASFRKSKHERPPALDDPALGTHGFLHLQDMKIHYVASGPEDKPLMLFLHGFPEFWYSWRHQIREFQNDYRCVAVDMRGYGESDKPTDIESYRTNFLMEDVKQIIIALGYKSCTLVGHDWGGNVAWGFGRNYPDMVDKLIVMNAPPSPVFKKILQTNRKQAKMSWYMFFFQMPIVPEFVLGLGDLMWFDNFSKKKDNKSFTQNPLSEEEVMAYKYTYSQSGAWTPPLNYYRAAAQLDPVMYDMDYCVPILLIWGTKDIALSTAVPDETEKCSSKVTVKRIEEAAHFVHADVPDKVNQAMREWLSQK